MLPFREAADRHTQLRSLLNLGPKSSGWLIEAGIKTVADVRDLGPIEVCRRVRARGHSVSVLLAYALEGALAGCHWNAIPVESRAYLRMDFAKMKKAEG